MQTYTDNVVDRAGNTLSGAQVTVYLADGTTKATLPANPIVTGADGEFSFSLPDGKYVVSVSHPLIATKTEPVYLFDSTTSLIPTVEEKTSFVNIPTADEKAGLAGISAADPAVQSSEAVHNVATIAALRLLPVVAGKAVQPLGYYAAGDGGGGPVRVGKTGAPGTYVDNGGSIIVPTGGDGSAAWVWEWSGAVNIMWCGAIAGGESAVAIRGANDIAKAAKSSVYFPGETFVASSELLVKAPWAGVPGKTKIIFDTDFAHTTTYTDPKSYGLMWNDNLTISGYNASTADIIQINGIEFDRRNTSGTWNILNLANVRGGFIRGCKFGSTGVSATMTNLNIHASVKNFDVYENEFRNETTSSAGGNIWVRNITTDAANAASATENIRVFNNLFVKNSGDESVAVSAVFGLVKNIRVANNKFEASGTTQGALLVAGVDANPSYTATAKVFDVHFTGNNIKTSSSQNEAIRAGVSGDNAANLENIYIDKNHIEYDAPNNTGTRAAIRKIAGTNVNASGNMVYNIGTTYAMQHGILAVDVAELNTIVDMTGATAATTNAIAYVNRAINNKVNTLGATGLFNVVYSRGNKVKALGPFVANETGQYDAEFNELEIAGTGVARNAVYANNLGGSVAPSIRIIGNTIKLNDGTNHRSILMQGTGTKVLVDNNIIGSGISPLGPLQITYARGNNWLGIRDDFHTSASIGVDLVAALPIGHFLRNSDAALAADANGWYLTGWVKIAAGTMQPVYASTTSFVK